MLCMLLGTYAPLPAPRLRGQLATVCHFYSFGEGLGFHLPSLLSTSAASCSPHTSGPSHFELE